MKNFLKIFLLACVGLLAVGVAHASQNLVLGLLSVPASQYAVYQLTGFSLVDDRLASALYCTPLIGIKRKCQAPQLGGNKRVFLLLTEDLTSEFLTYELAKTDGEYNDPIPLAVGKTAKEIEAWYDTTKWDTDMKPGAGFTQGCEFDVLGYDSDIVKLAALLYEAPTNVIITGNDNKQYYLGQKYVPLMFEMVGMSPVKGTDRKKATFRAKNDGFTVPVMPLGSGATFTVAALT